MEKFKTVIYKPGTVNVPKMINEILDKEYEEQTNEYYIFAQEDIIQNALNERELCLAYTDFMDKWNIPFCMYYYYSRFNSVLPETNNIPNPRFKINSEKGKFDIVSQPAYGFLVLNISLLKSKNIRLDSEFPEIFYLQDLAEQCFQENLWISNCNFMEIQDSWKMFHTHTNDGYNIDIKKFVEEKKKYNACQHHYHSPNEFIELLKKFLKDGKIEVAETDQNGMIDLTKLVENS